jgi:hypothetical protein
MIAPAGCLRAAVAEGFRRLRIELPSWAFGDHGMAGEGALSSGAPIPGRTLAATAAAASGPSACPVAG